MSKYYTPSIEEFHVGFEYEAKSYISDNWLKTVWNINSKYEEQFTRDMRNGMHEPLIYIEEDKIRVKHLDREDIESLGFFYDNNAEPIPNHDINPVYHGYLLEKNSGDDQWLLYYFDAVQEVWIDYIHDCGGEGYVFKGTIKNKSELKRLLKQLGI